MKQETNTSTPQESLKVAISDECELVVDSLGLTEKLFAIQKYVNRAQLGVKGETYLRKRFGLFVASFLTKVIGQEFDRIEKMLKEQESADNDKLFKALVAKGVDITTAYNQAYDITKTPAMPPLPVTIPAK